MAARKAMLVYLLLSYIFVVEAARPVATRGPLASYVQVGVLRRLGSSHVSRSLASLGGPAPWENRPISDGGNEKPKNPSTPRGPRHGFAPRSGSNPAAESISGGPNSRADIKGTHSP